MDSAGKPKLSVVNAKNSGSDNVVTMTFAQSKSVNIEPSHDAPSEAEAACDNGVCLLAWKPAKKNAAKHAA